MLRYSLVCFALLLFVLVAQCNTVGDSLAAQLLAESRKLALQHLKNQNDWEDEDEDDVAVIQDEVSEFVQPMGVDEFDEEELLNAFAASLNGQF
jgi:5,10-methylene-tetrahydrofolate dehydrogenase/methenyl tetrahydrofolate cyclohydrolase